MISVHICINIIIISYSYQPKTLTTFIFPSASCCSMFVHIPLQQKPVLPKTLSKTKGGDKSKVMYPDLWVKPTGCFPFGPLSQHSTGGNVRSTRGIFYNIKSGIVEKSVTEKNRIEVDEKVSEL